MPGRRAGSALAGGRVEIGRGSGRENMANYEKSV